MIYLYTGTPGSGKSLHSAKDIYTKLKRGGNVIANFPVNLETIGINKIKGRFYYLDNEDFTVDYLIRFSEVNHEKDKEGQTLVIIDECSVLFNPRDYMHTNRKKWLSFFAQHRKYGYNFILVAQMDKQVDKQILGCVENEVKHKKANNYKLFWLLPFPLFVASEYWYTHSKRGTDDTRLSVLFYPYRRKYGADFYNTFMQFDKRLMLQADDKEGLDKLIKTTEISLLKKEGGPKVQKYPYGPLRRQGHRSDPDDRPQEGSRLRAGALLD